jgi:hypothetical protein
MRKACIKLIVFFLVLTFPQVQHSKTPEQNKGLASHPGSNRIQSLNSLPSFFVENTGQMDECVKFHLKLPAGNVYFTPEEIVYQFIHRKQKPKVDWERLLQKEHERPGEIKIENIRARFVGANEKVKIDSSEKAEAKFNYLRGNDPTKWVKGASAYKKIIYKKLYPQIDLKVTNDKGILKQEYHVEAGGEVTDIAVEFEGINRLNINEKGQLEIEAQGGILREDFPLSYQIIDGKKVEVDVNYIIDEENKNMVRFKVEKFQKDRELVIDPAMVYSTFLGGDHFEYCYEIEIDQYGNAYVVGYTQSSTFPTTPGAYDTILDGDYDLFIAKLDSLGSSLIYSTLLGGSGSEFSWGDLPGLAIDIDGNAYLTGNTYSTDFPTTAGAYDTTSNGGNKDAFITKINSSGSNLIYSTYLGGSGDECGSSITVDDSGDAYVTGFTDSNNFPLTPGAYDSSFNGSTSDVFITKIDSSGTSLVYSTYLGGSSTEFGRGIVIDTNGNAYIAGSTGSSDFPTTPSAYDTTFSNGDAFVTKINATGSALVYSTFIGGSDGESSLSISKDDSDNVYITGDTASSDFPATPGAYDTSFNGIFDAYVAKINASGTGLVYATYLGGTSDEAGWDIDTDGSGTAYVVGLTMSGDFPTSVDAYDGSLDGEWDAFVSAVDPTGAALSYSTYLGGSNEDLGRGIAFGGMGDICVVGTTYSSDFPATSGAFDETYNTGGDAFITNLGTFCPLPDVPDNPSPTDGTSGISLTPTLTWTSSAAISYDVYFGPSSPPPKVAIVFAQSYSPGTLMHNTTYYWRIVAKNSCGGTSGLEWNFTTINPIPSTPINPSPADDDTNVPTTTDLDWDDSIGATSYDVYFGTTYPPGYLGNTITSYYDLPRLQFSTQYYWRVVAKNTFGENAGDEWNFTTESAPAFVYLVVHGHDFNGDGSSDVSVFRPSNGRWYIKSVGGFVWGQVGDIPVNGDYNGDGTTDIAVWRPSNGRWYLRGIGSTTWGISGDIPVPGNYDGDVDGTTDIAVWRPSNGRWYIMGAAALVWGTAGDIPVPGDYNGDGITDIAVWRPSNGRWYIQGMASYAWGTSGDIPVPGDYNGDGTTDIAVWRPSNGRWYIMGMAGASWGTSGDIPAPGDYNGDGIADIAVWRPSNGRWYIKGIGGYFWGMLGDIPLVR